LGLVHYKENEFSERCKEGLLDGLKLTGLAVGKDYNLKIYNARDDMSTLSGIMNTIQADQWIC